MFYYIHDRLEYPSARNARLMPMNQLLITLSFTLQEAFSWWWPLCHWQVDRLLHSPHSDQRNCSTLREKYVKFPATSQEQHDNMQLFYSKSGLPGVFAAIDCMHTSVQSPGCDDGEMYRNRKGFSINVQLASDCTGYISGMVTRWSGSVHESFCLGFLLHNILVLIVVQYLLNELCCK